MLSGSVADDLLHIDIRLNLFSKKKTLLVKFPF